MQFRCPHMTLPAGMTSHLTMSPLATDQTSPSYRSALPYAFSCSCLVLPAMFTLSLLLIHTVLLANCCKVVHGQQHDDFIFFLLTVVGLLVVLLLPPTYSCVYLGHWSKGPWPHPGPLSLPQNGSRSFSADCWHRSQLHLHKDSTCLKSIDKSQSQLLLIAGCIISCACWDKLCACRHQWQWQIHRATLTIQVSLV